MKPASIDEVASAYVAARQAYLAQATPPLGNTRTVLTDLVDEWISFLSNPGVNLRAPRVQVNRDFAYRSAEWTSLIHEGGLINAGQAVAVQQEEKFHNPTRAGSQSPFHNSSSESPDGESSEESDSDGSDDSQPPLIKPEPRGDDEQSGTLHTPVSSSTPHALAVNNTAHSHKRKAQYDLAQAAIKRRAAFYASASNFDTSDEDFDSDIESDPEVDVKGALAELRELAEKRHTRQLTKLRKMKSRYSNQKKQVANLQEQVAEVTDAQSTQASLSTTVKGNAKSLKGLTKDLEHQKKTVEKVEARIDELKARKAGECDATIQNLMDKVQAHIRAEVKTTWTGAAMELSNTKRDFFQTMNDQGRRFNGQNERLDSFESRYRADFSHGPPREVDS
jgi:flagellar biosynthesis chaperone FliJ